MDPKQDKAKPIRKGSQYPADNEPKTEGKKAGYSSKWCCDDDDPSNPIIYEIHKPATVE